MKNEKILVIKHGAFGDFIHQLELMKSIRATHKNAEITLITAKAQEKLANASGYFDNIVIDNRTYKLKDWYRVIKKTIVDGNFDIIYNLQGSKRVVNKYIPIARFLSDHNLIIRYPKIKENTNFNEVTFYKNHSFTLGRKEVKTYNLELEAEDLSFCKLSQDIEKILPKEPFVLLIPGCSVGHDYKRWSPQNYGQLAKDLEQENIKTVIIGTSAEKDNIEKIIEICPSAINLMDKTLMTDLPPIGKRALVSVGNDTGPTHFVSVSKANVIALFGPQTAHAQDKSPNVLNFVGKNSINEISVTDVKNACMKYKNNLSK